MISPIQFSAPDLSEIAHELDEDESRELDEEERAQTSNNMDDTGALYFSDILPGYPPPCRSLHPQRIVRTRSVCLLTASTAYCEEIKQKAIGGR